MAPRDHLRGIPRPAKETPSERVLSGQEITDLWRAMDESSSKHAKVCMLILATAQRGDTVRALTAEQIDGDWWTIPRTKAGRSFRVFLNEIAREIVREQGRDAGYVFPGFRDPTVPLSRSLRSLKSIREKSGVIDWTPRDLRRTAATHMAMNGVHPFTISKILDHTDPRGMTPIYDRYSYEPEIREGLDTWGKHLQALIS